MLERDKEDRTIAPRCVAVALFLVSATRSFFGLQGDNHPPNLPSPLWL
ncbi:hypothetical protein POREN0001_1134 [Porphyromonas endodontalis ATCC 35406]|uniref:Uncharacterized protein n=1 Tax=Porphyromonas endodontalis (strain ATCC 35406 / DSM 24491 / JCM 8526 / CCUG 16442 / BCRC 14492 / NCTC 13058 / HG 370) TaxID=553175 RepID=C3J7P5_POREA|nr:hypothetical protein POREN0001_1134 [Porphyromonas endodontalis ATCC 35406]